MNGLVLAGSILGLAVYIPFFIDIALGRSEQNFASMVLWAMLDAIAAASIAHQQGNFLLPAIYSVSSALVAVAIVKSKGFVWTRLETGTAVLVALCAAAWEMSDARTATIAATAAFLIAGIPTLGNCIKNPEKNPFWIYLGFFAADMLTLAGGTRWSVNERLYPAACAAFCAVAMILMARRNALFFFRKLSRGLVQQYPPHLHSLPLSHTSRIG